MMWHQVNRWLCQTARRRIYTSALLFASSLVSLVLLARGDLSSAVISGPTVPPGSASGLELEVSRSGFGDGGAKEHSTATTSGLPSSSSLTQSPTDTVAATDIVLVFDESGSMDDDTYCFRDNSGSPCYIQGDNEYPEGDRLYLPFGDWICATQVPTTDSGFEILVAEAEYFSYTTSYGEHPYHRDYNTFPGTFWMLQRTQDSQASGYRYEQGDRRGAHLMHMPLRLDLPGHLTVTADAPRLDYSFSILVSGTWYAWVRAQCGAAVGDATQADGCLVHWGVDGAWREGASTDVDDFGERGTFEAGSNDNRWIWAPLGSAAFSDTLDHEINIWGGGIAFRLDKVLLTRNPEGPGESTSFPDRAPSFIRNTTPDWVGVQYDEYQTYYYLERYGGPPDTRGRTGLACLPCNPIYGLVLNQGCTVGQAPGLGCTDPDGNEQIDDYEICDNRYDDMFDDNQPIRAAQEAAKAFLYRQRARVEKVGLVVYSTRYSQDVLRELMCLGTPVDGLPMPDYPGLWDPEAGPDPAWIWCFDHRLGPDGYSWPKRSTNTTYGSIIQAVEDVQAGGLTNVADGLRMGIEQLGTSPGHYGRSCATSVVVLLLDKVPNRWPGYPNCGPASCCEHDLYLPNDGTDDENKARDCAVYYADVAQERGAVVYTVGLGPNADHALLQGIADRTGGSYYHAPKGGDLRAAYQQVADQILFLAPSFEMNQHAAPIPVVPGDRLTYTLAVTNTGAVDLQATITAVLPAHVTPTGTLTWTPTVSASGGVWTQTVPVTVEAGYAGPLTSVLKVATQGCITLTDTLVLKPGMEVTKRSSWRVRPGELLTYTIAVTNSGDFDLHAAITDVLPAHVMLAGGLTEWTPTITAPNGVWTGTVVVTVEAGYVGPLTNVVRVAAEEGVTGVYTHTLAPGIEATKVAHTDVVRPSQPLSYTISVTNTGDFDLAVAISDVLPAHVTPTGVLTWTPTITAPGGVWQETVVVTIENTYAGSLSNVLQVASAAGTMTVCTATVTVEPWWLYLPLVLRLFP